MKEDDLLVQFVRTNRLAPPPAHPQLEDRLINQLDSITGSATKPIGLSIFWLKIVGGIGLTVSLWGLGQLRRMQTASNVIDYKQLEASLIQNWEATTEEFPIDLFNYQEN